MKNMFFGGQKRYSVELLGSEKLRQVAADVLKVDDDIRNLAENMIRTMHLFNGIGLAAPQVGVPLRLVVFDIPAETCSEAGSPGEELLLPRMPLAVINPQIISAGGEIAPYNEGCLSVPEIYAEIMRPSRVVFKATDLAGGMIECECAGLLGRCILHELDHLDGKLFVDYLSDEQQKELSGKLSRLDKYGARHDYVRSKKSY